MKVIFLDFDGVLNHGLGSTDPERPFFAEHLALFHRVLDETGAKVVISSSWRTLIGPGQDYSTKEGFFRFLREEGLEADVIDVTPVLRLLDRGQEIEHWLQHSGADAFSIDDYLIFDDCIDEHMPIHHTLAFDREIGLTEELAEKAIHRLKRGEWPAGEG